MNYEKLKEALIEKGADSKLFDMPAVRERIEKAYSGKKSYSLDDFTINFDGTFNFGNCGMQKGIIEREEIVPTGTATRVIDPINGETEEYTVYEKQKVKKEVLTVVEQFEKVHPKNQALDAPFNLGDEYESTFKETAAQLTIINDDGIEIETHEIDNGYSIRSELQKGSLSYKFFEEHPELVNRKLTRAKGIVNVEYKDDFPHADGKYEFYDNGSWKMEPTGASIGTREGNSPVGAIKGFEYNSQELLKKYPHLQDSIKEREKELEEVVDARMSDVISENENLRSQNKRLQEMLQRVLTFVQTVRDSKVGKIFFGKKAEKVLGEQGKKAKKLPELEEK